MKTILLLISFSKFIKSTENFEEPQVPTDNGTEAPALSTKASTLSTETFRELFLEKIKRDDVRPPDMVNTTHHFMEPFRYPVDIDGLNRYPLHMAILNKSFKTVQLIIHRSNVPSLMDQKDYLGRTPLDYAIKYYPLVATKCLTKKTFSDQGAIERIIDSVFGENPLPYLDLLIKLTLRTDSDSKQIPICYFPPPPPPPPPEFSPPPPPPILSPSPLATFVVICIKFINSPYSNSKIYETFLDLYLIGIFFPNYIYAKNGKLIHEGSKFSLDGLDIKVFEELYKLASEKGCYSFLKNENLIKNTKLTENTIFTILNYSTHGHDPFVFKHLLNTIIKAYKLKPDAISKKLQVIGKPRVSLSESLKKQEEEEEENRNRIHPADKFLEYRHLFDLKFFRSEPEEDEEVSPEMKPYVLKANKLLSLLTMDPMKAAETKSNSEFFKEIMQAKLDHTPFPFVIALHNPEFLKLLLYNEDIDEDLLKLIACYAPQAVPSKVLNNLRNTVKFVLSDRCKVADEIKGQFFAQFDLLTTVKNSLSDKTYWPRCRLALIDKSNSELTQFIEKVLEYEPLKLINIYELLYKTVAMRDLKLSIKILLIFLQSTQAEEELKKTDTITFKEVISRKLDYLLKFLDYVDSEKVDKNELCDLHERVISIAFDHDYSEAKIAKFGRLILLRLWRINPNLINLKINIDSSLIQTLIGLANENTEDVVLDTLMCLIKLDNFQIERKDVDALKTNEKFRVIHDFLTEKMKE